VTPRPPANLPRQPRFDPLVFGTLCGLLSAFAYTCANSFLRAVDSYDPFWVSAVKALPTVIAMVPVMAAMRFKGERVWPAPKLMAMIAAGGLMGQIGGNVSFQWSLDKIGVALAVPLCLGGMILGAATLSRIFLREPITPRAALALGMLLLAIFVLALGAEDAGRSVAAVPLDPWRLAAGVAAACASGFFYSTLNVILRHCFVQGSPLPTSLGIVAVVGVLSLTTMSWMRIGGSGMLATQPGDLLLMIGAGISNTVAFVALTKSLQLTNVVYVNALNATQATLAAIAGVVIFREALSPWLALGVGLTIIGLLLMTRAQRRTVFPEKS
jgi:drug/metabolite transporter (DMT)-like permease